MRMSGRVKYYNAAKGYGFVTPNDGGKDIFLHVTAVQKSHIVRVTEGLELSFELQNDTRGRGPQAIKLELVKQSQEVT
jgi:cold shock protein